jgi:DNA-directed RNA polymerase alpha subunit
LLESPFRNKINKQFRKRTEMKTKRNEPKDDFLSSLSAPARRALENNGITSIKELSKFSEKEILKFHGIGKSTIPILKRELENNGLLFKK